MPDINASHYAIPLLPCISINETEDFYKALGAVTTYKQKAPNHYIALALNKIDIHFFALKQLPSNNYSTCYFIVSAIDPFYEACRAGIKALYGKIPLKGYPRLNPLKDMPSYGVRQFIIVDPNGNYIRIGQPIKKTAIVKGSPLAKAHEAAGKLADAKGDFVTAAKVLDKALAANSTDEPLNLLKALVLRADIALRLADTTRFRELINAAEVQLKLVPTTSALEERRLLAELKASI